MSVRTVEPIVHKAAWLYYAHVMRQEEVAEGLDISRAAVAAYLKKAREVGIVNISTSTELFSADFLARRPLPETAGQAILGHRNKSL